LLLLITFILGAYLLGAIPFGALFARFRGIDIQKQGSGNIGATNVSRVLGKGWGIVTLLLDVGKGFLPVFLASKYMGGALAPALVGLAAVSGHMWPVYLKFKGGKGVATGLGAFLAFYPPAVGVALLVWLLMVALFRYVSLGSMAAAAAVPLALAFFRQPTEIILLAAVMAGLIIYKHKDNIKRLLAGTESKIGQKA
jgi:glycerol-3-phosphate acyltransferase PlsY